MADQVALYAPAEYWSATPEVRRAVANGCGPSGWRLGLLTNRFFLLDMSKVCDIHDWMYAFGQTAEDKEEADRVFLNNMLRVINATGGFWVLVTLRRRKAKSFYKLVKYFGGPFFWRGKNEPENIGHVVLQPRLTF